MIDPLNQGTPSVPSRTDDAGDKRGIAVIANDKVMHWLLPFLESYLATNASIPLFLIPYDDNVNKTRKVADAYGVSFVDIDSRELDALSKRLYPFSLGKRFRLRKLLSLALPLDRVVYLDVDIILFRDLRPLLDLIAPGEVDFLIIAKTIEYVYNKKAVNYPYLRDPPLFNDGFFITSNKILTIQHFYDAMAADEKIFHEVRQRGGLYAQPLTNFVVHRKGLKVVPVYELVPDASGESYHKAQGVTFCADGPLDKDGAKIYFAHWPGITGAPKGGMFDDLWADYTRRADARMAAEAI